MTEQRVDACDEGRESDADDDVAPTAAMVARRIGMPGFGAKLAWSSR